MKQVWDITGEVTWLEDMDQEQMASIHQCMREYAKEVLRDYDKWQLPLWYTPQLIEQYIKEKRL